MILTFESDTLCLLFFYRTVDSLGIERWGRWKKVKTEVKRFIDRN